MELILKNLAGQDGLHHWKQGFKEHSFFRSEEYYTTCLEENLNGTRVTILAYMDGKFAGCGHLISFSDYPYFRDNGIPEISDLNVFPEFRRNGIASGIMEMLEGEARRTSPVIGIGVGLFKSYGSAQRLYFRRGYIPDGNGISYQNVEVKKGTQVRVDDDLVLCFTKKLK